MAKPKFNVIVKVTNDKFLKYRGVTNFNRMIIYLNEKYPYWRWFNYYQNIKPYKQLGSYTRKNGYRKI